MITKEKILELAKTCGFTDFIGVTDEETSGVFWDCWEEQLIEFAEKIYQSGRYDGYDSGYDAAFYEHGGY